MAILTNPLPRGDANAPLTLKEVMAITSFLRAQRLLYLAENAYGEHCCGIAESSLTRKQAYYAGVLGVASAVLTRHIVELPEKMRRVVDATARDTTAALGEARPWRGLRMNVVDQ